MAFRDGPFENLKVPLVWTAALALIIAAAASVVLLLADRRDTMTEGGYGAARETFDTGAAPLGGIFAAPFRWAGQLSDYVGGYFFAVGENRRLREQVSELEAWRDQAIALKNLNSRYEAMLGLRTEPPVAMVTARSVSEARGPFVNSRLIDVGADRGVRNGNPVISEHGLVGRVVGVTGSVSRVLLLTDVASRTPVLIDRTDARAILSGDGSGNPKLEFVRGADAVRAGDRVLSSGDGGGIPRGLPIGVAARGVDGSWRVKLFSDRGAIDLLRVLLFQDFAQLIDPEALNSPPLAALDTAPPPTGAEAAAIADAAARRRAAAEQAALQQAARDRVARQDAAARATPPPAAAAPARTTPTRPAATRTSPATTAPATAAAPPDPVESDAAPAEPGGAR